jgi:uncharacterized Zn-binding protein involved in type VI secretion
MPPAARATDMHVCPMVTGIVPHVGGPILPPCEPTVLIGFLPAARVTDMLTCVGPPDIIVMGSPTVLIGGLMAARLGDPTAHGAVILLGCFTVMIGEAGVPAPSAPSAPSVPSVPSAPLVASKDGGDSPTPPAPKPESWVDKNKEALRQALKDQAEMLKTKKDALEKWDDAAKADFKKWFGKTDDASKKKIQDRIDKMLELNKNFKVEQFKPASPEKDSRFAYVYPTDKARSVYIDKAFHNAPAKGKDSKAGAISHEMSHFDSVGGTKDHQYGPSKCKNLAEKDPDKALENADSFEYFLEGVN